MKKDDKEYQREYQKKYRQEHREQFLEYQTKYNELRKKYRRSFRREYAYYKDDDLIMYGTIKEIAETTGLKSETLHFYATQVHKNRIAKSKKGKGPALEYVGLKEVKNEI